MSLLLVARGDTEIKKEFFCPLNNYELTQRGTN